MVRTPWFAATAVACEPPWPSTGSRPSPGRGSDGELLVTSTSWLFGPAVA